MSGSYIKSGIRSHQFDLLKHYREIFSCFNNNIVKFKRFLLGCFSYDGSSEISIGGCLPIARILYCACGDNFDDVAHYVEKNVRELKRARKIKRRK